MGLYLQGLEEAQGIRTVARDEAEGGIGQGCPRVDPKEAQEGSSTSEPRASCPSPHLAPLMASQPPTPTLPNSQCTDPPSCSHVNKNSCTHPATH